MLKAALLTLTSAVFFSFMSIFIRLGSEELHAFQIAFFRNLFGLCFILPWLFRSGSQVLKTNRTKLFLLRAVFGTFAMLSFFWSISQLPLAEAISLSFTAPLFVTIGAALFLQETVRLRRWTATIFGFMGVMVMLRPDQADISSAHLIGLLAAAGIAGSVLVMKRLTQTENTTTIVAYMLLLMVPMSALPALSVWKWPSSEVWVYMLALGVSGTIAQLFFTRAMNLADASAIMPFDFARLPITSVLAFVIFDQVVGIWVWVGAVMIFLSGAYIAQRELAVEKYSASVRTCRTNPEVGQIKNRSDKDQ